jgi:hypothetical protein
MVTTRHGRSGGGGVPPGGSDLRQDEVIGFGVAATSRFNGRPGLGRFEVAAIAVCEFGEQGFDDLGVELGSGAAGEFLARLCFGHGACVGSVRNHCVEGVAGEHDP